MKTPVDNFFEKYSATLVTFSPEAIASHYNNPVTIYSDEGIRFVDDEAETLAFWQEGVKPYQDSGIENTAFEIQLQEQLSQTHHVAKVLWINRDKTGNETGRETNFYMLTQNDDELKISGLVLMDR